MPQKIKPTSRQKSIFFLHVVVYIVVTAIIWYLYKAEGDRTHKWVYPWQAWITAAWGLSLIGHWCALYTSYEDKGMDDYHRQANNG
ncbi:2TM domain-containing protein [Chitinophagaceae bacterium MMS25-I14]